MSNYANKKWKLASMFFVYSIVFEKDCKEERIGVERKNSMGAIAPSGRRKKIKSPKSCMWRWGENRGRAKIPLLQ